MKTKYLYINSIGCQMNVYDADQIVKRLKSLKYIITDIPERADLIIVHTCAIREKAEQKTFSFLGRLSGMKKKNPNLIIGVGGCVAQQEGKSILERVPHVDLVFGTHAIPRIPDLIKQIEQKRFRVVDIEMSDTTESVDSLILPIENQKASVFITIMQGCENYCTYCVVPYVRGRETSRNPKDIIKEIKAHVKSGIREVTLLGQNVNSYGTKEGGISFPELLRRVNDIEDLLRIRFTTSHPKDLSDELALCFKELPKLCNHIHLPVQSGSSKILKKMNRKYTREAYLGKIEKLRKFCPDIAITSDFIVGFPGETEADFNETLDLIKKVEFDGVFAFKYSDRPNVPASGFSGKLSEYEKSERLQNLLTVQEQFTVQKNKALSGSIQPVLIEGLSKKQKNIDRANVSANLQWAGRTTTNKIVNFYMELPDFDDKNFTYQNYMGKIINVKIEKACSHSLYGIKVNFAPVSQQHVFKGGKSYAA